MLYAFISGGEAMVGRAIVGLILIVAILWLPDGVIPAIQHWAEEAAAARLPGARAEVVPVVPAAAQPIGERTILEVRAVTKRFGGLQALAGVDLDVREGEIFGLVGPNGSGKTTLINVISGHYPLDQRHGHGRRRVDRQPAGARDRPPRRRAHLPDPAAVREHERARQRRAWPPRSAARSAPDGKSATRRRTGSASPASAGKEEALPAELNLHERKFLELARALAAKPKLLLLDEVLSGLNPAEIDNAIRLVRAIRGQGATIVFVEHLMRAVVELSDRIAVLNEGKLFALGAPRDVMRDPRVVSIYLGKAYAA